MSNGPTEGMNNLLKRVKRVAFGFTNFENFRIRALLYAGKPNFRVLDSIVRGVTWLTPQKPEEPENVVFRQLVEVKGLEPSTYGLQSRRSSS